MKRRNFIKNTALIGASTAAATATLSAPALAQSKKKWIAVSAFGKAGLLGQALDGFANSVGQMSGGRLTIDTYHAGELVAPFEAIDAVQSGTAQMGYGAPYSDELIKAIGERATTVIPELAQKSADATELYNNLVTFRKTMVQWSGYSEGNFMNKCIAASFQTI